MRFKIFSGLVLSMIIFGFLLMFSVIGFRAYLVYQNMKINKKTYEISVPRYNGTTEIFLTNSYVEKDGCVMFTDEFGFNKKICNNYNITEWNTEIFNQ